MRTDPFLLVFLVGCLTGAAAMLLARRIPDFIFLTRRMFELRKVRTEKGRRYFLS